MLISTSFIFLHVFCEGTEYIGTWSQRHQTGNNCCIQRIQRQAGVTNGGYYFQCNLTRTKLNTNGLVVPKKCVCVCVCVCLCVCVCVSVCVCVCVCVRSRARAAGLNLSFKAEHKSRTLNQLFEEAELPFRLASYTSVVSSKHFKKSRTSGLQYHESNNVCDHCD